MARHAREFALHRHGAQRYGNVPYINHLDMVVELLLAYGCPVVEVTAGYLHDLIEDTTVRGEDIAAEFGNMVATLVSAVSRRGSGSVESSREYFFRILHTGLGACRVKTADRIANISASIILAQSDPVEAERYLRKYLDEQAAMSQLETPMRDSKIGTAMWMTLEGLLKAAEDPVAFYRRTLEAKYNI